MEKTEDQPKLSDDALEVLQLISEAGNINQIQVSSKTVADMFSNKLIDVEEYKIILRAIQNRIDHLDEEIKKSREEITNKLIDKIEQLAIYTHVDRVLDTAKKLYLEGKITPAQQIKILDAAEKRRNQYNKVFV